MTASGTDEQANMATIKENLRSQWVLKYKKAVQFDIWGQIVEAQEEYRQLAQVMAAKQGQLIITSNEKDVLHRLIMCLSARVESLRTGAVGPNSVNSSEMKSLEQVFETVFSEDEETAATAATEFPVATAKFNAATPIQPSSEGEILCGDNKDMASDFYHSHQAITKVKGTVVSLRLDKIGLKDAQFYIDPIMTVLVVDSRGDIMDKHDAPTQAKRRPTHVMLNHTVYLNISFEEMQQCNASIFLEFKHFKPKKKKISTRCWTFMELSELKRDEEIVLELYQKPTDLKKKKLKLHTEKQLYMHLFATFIRP